MTWTLSRLLETALAEAQVVLLRNEHGTVELRGEDLALESGGEWLTLFHAGASPGPEARSHIHLRRGRLRYATIAEREGRTPVLELWPSRAALSAARASGGRPPLALMFRSFYDWGRDRAPIPEHRRRFEAWVAENGREFDLEVQP